MDGMGDGEVAKIHFRCLEKDRGIADILSSVLTNVDYLKIQYLE